MTGPTSRVRESRRLQVGDMPEATGPLSLRPHGANPEATFSCLPASTEVTALEKKKAFLPDTAVASRAERSAPAPQTRLPGPRDSMTRRAVRLASPRVPLLPEVRQSRSRDSEPRAPVTRDTLQLPHRERFS